MTASFPSLKRISFAAGRLAVCLLFSLVCPVTAQPVVLHLKSGDQISGLIISESTNQVVISNAWVKALAIPLAEISKRDQETIEPESKPPEATPAETASAAQPAAPTVAGGVAPPAIKLPPKPKGTWKGQVSVGLNVIVSTTDQQNYSGHLKLVYERPNHLNPKKFFRNTINVDGDYQRTDGKESANHGYVRNKTDFDIDERFYGYSLLGTGFDEVEKIDYQFQAGPGVGLHLVQHKSFVLNVESGMNYSAQFRRNTSNLKTLSVRLAHDFTWNIYKNLKLSEDWAFYPDTDGRGQFKNNIESTLSYGFWKNLTLNLTAIDNYNTEPAPSVANNRFELRTSLGIQF